MRMIMAWDELSRERSEGKSASLGSLALTAHRSDTSLNSVAAPHPRQRAAKQSQGGDS